MQINFGIIGYGRIAKRFISNLEATEGKLYGIASRSQNGEEIKQETNCEVVYDTYEKLLADPQVDIIYIALPHKFHYPVLMQCIAYHKAVICEKPLVLNNQEMVAVMEVARKEKVLVMEALKTRMIPAYHQLKKDIESIELESVECGFCYAMPKNDSYLFDPIQGGALLDVGSYSIGFVLDIVKGKVVKVESKIKKEYGVDVHFNATLTFDDGVVAYVEGAMDEAKPSIAILKGKKGMIRVPYYYRPSHIEIEYYDTNEKIIRDYDGSLDMRYEINEMIDLYQAKKIESDLMSLEDSYAISMIMERIREVSE